VLLHPDRLIFKMIKKSVLYIILFFSCLDLAKSQELVIGLQSNPFLKNGKEKFPETKNLADTLELPLFDDFSGSDIFPDSKKWDDDYVLINNTYTKDQITTGVATFDALDNTGRLYDNAYSIVFEADHLTSQPINLNYSATENIWISFYYQPGGLADIPEENDSLTLQLFAPVENKWYPVWKATGGAYSDFKAAIIKIDKSRFLKKGFRFRFINYASLSANLNNDPSMVSNCDQWNIDIILLDKNRNAGDTIFTDVAFRYPLRSLLKTHEAMPWKQFKQIYTQEMGMEIPIHYRNNDTIVRNVTRNFEIWDVYKNSLAKLFSAGATNIDPLTNVDFNANMVYTFSTDNDDSALFKVTSWLVTDTDPKENDTLVYYQKFSNYFAFDDGSAEGGYGISGLGSRNAMVAYRFKSYMPDTLRAIRICFNDSYLNANLRAFDLKVWDDNNGVPGNVLYTHEGAIVEQAESINGFYTYFIRGKVAVNDIFYVGWKQRSETFLNVGFDLNTPNEGRQLFWINGTWTQSSASGSIMIRPVVGKSIITSINDIKYSNKTKLHFWPNPANDYITFDSQELPVSDLIYISVFDLQGRQLLNVPFSERIDISSLREGIYIVVANLNGKSIGYNRLVRIK
jgi:hypothetical protein